MYYLCTGFRENKCLTLQNDRNGIILRMYQVEDCYELWSVMEGVKRYSFVYYAIFMHIYIDFFEKSAVNICVF